MTYDIYQVDAFTDRVFHGNPACVVPLKKWLPTDVLLSIAKENGVAETAFFIYDEDCFHLRWFTPDLEIDLCGHATLAAAHIIKTELKYNSNIKFKTISGNLYVKNNGNLYYLDLPSRPPIISKLPNEIKLSLNIQPQKVYKSRDYLLLYKKQEEIENIIINRTNFDRINLGHGGVIVTALGEEFDFVSRFFTPQATILEDPVTGSAHCSLIPFWSSILSKQKLIGSQLSKRGGTLYCENIKDRVIVGGKAITYSKGIFSVKTN